MMRATPMMMAMPMMPMMMGTQVRAVSFEDTRERAAEPTCASSKTRLDELDARVEALHLRLQTVQRAVEIQTTILQELKAQGSIGGKRPRE